MLDKNERHWRMWLLGMLSTELNADLTTLYRVLDDPQSALGTQIRGTIDTLILFDDGTRLETDMLNIAHEALSQLVRRYKPVVSCQECAE